MARLAAVEKGEYYPTPLARLDDILPHIDVDGEGLFRLFDPCCGEGIALEHLAQGLKASYPKATIQTWGIEISPTRAEEASKRLDHVLKAPFEACAFFPSKVKSLTSLVLLNPPYDSGQDGKRFEQTFLERVVGWMGLGSMLIYIIPVRQLTWTVANVLYEHFEDLQVYRFPDEGGPGGFAAFQQLFILGRREERESQHGYDAVQNLYKKGYGARECEIQELPVRPVADVVYALPPSAKSGRMRRRDYTSEEIIQACQEDPLYQDAARQLYPASAEMEDPLRPPRDGHIAQMVAGGLTGTLVTNGTAFKGMVLKRQVVIPDPDDETKETVKDVYTTHVSRVCQDGLQHFWTPNEVGGFLREHADTFKRHILDTFVPYGNHASPWEERLLDTVSLDKKLPGCEKAGLLPDQRNIAVALCRAVERYGVAHLVAKMGYGKSRTSLAAVEILNAYPFLVTCPPHLVENWVEEAQAAIPGLQGVIIETITELENVVACYKPGDKLMVVLSTSRAKLGPGWEPQFAYRHTLARKDQRSSAFTQAAAAYKQAREAKAPNRADLRKAAMSKAHRYAVCPTCGLPLAEGGRFKSLNDVTKKPKTCNHARGTSVWNAEEEQWDYSPCSGPLYQSAPKIARRWPLADYIRLKHKGFFKLALVDEVHKCMAKGTDIGYILQWIANMMPVITLTGTFFGGTASSIFYLLYRTQANVRRDFGFNCEQRWVERFGVMERTYKTDEDDYGAGNAKRRRLVSVKERPGLSPEAIKYFLPTAAFAQVTDLGLAMPAYQEEIVDLALGPTRDHISWFKSLTWSEMIENWPRWTSSWLQWNLARPNSAFRHEVMTMANGEEVELPAEIAPGQLLSKEQWMIDLVKSEMAQRRKVIIYPRQTGTRDIRGRLQEILAVSGITGVSVLGSNVPTRQRLKWLRKNARSVLITNPRLVETGMNLHDYGYCTIIFYEIEYSLYTLWQAMSRVWRPGQTKGVKVFFSKYRGTLEESALSLVSKKMLAGQLLYGDDVSGALVEDTGDSSLVIELIRAIKEGEDLTLGDDAHIFGIEQSEIVSESPIGSPTVRSKPIMSLEDWLMRKHGMSLDEARGNGKRSNGHGKKQAVPQAQLALF